MEETIRRFQGLVNSLTASDVQKYARSAASLIERQIIFGQTSKMSVGALKMHILQKITEALESGNDRRIASAEAFIAGFITAVEHQKRRAGFAPREDMGGPASDRRERCSYIVLPGTVDKMSDAALAGFISTVYPKPLEVGPRFPSPSLQRAALEFALIDTLKSLDSHIESPLTKYNRHALMRKKDAIEDAVTRFRNNPRPWIEYSEQYPIENHPYIHDISRRMKDIL
jgi:hypothetical protein